MQYMIMSLATLAVLGWFALCVKYKDGFDAVIASIDEESYRMPELFYAGFGIMDLIHFDLSSRKARKRIHEIAEIYGKKYAQYHYYVTKGGEFTYGYLAFSLMSLLAALAGRIELLMAGIILVVLVVVHLEQDLDSKLSDRRDELLSEFPQVLSKLALLVNSGMVMREAWEKVADAGEGVIYQEMRTAVQEFHNGLSELEVYRNFAERCGLKEIRRFSSTMIQNLQKGNAQIAYFLREMSDEMWEEKKHLAKRKGEAINSKLMLPTGLIFIGILVMVMVPAFTAM